MKPFLASPSLLNFSSCREITFSRQSCRASCSSRLILMRGQQSISPRQSRWDRSVALRLSAKSDSRARQSLASFSCSSMSADSLRLGRTELQLARSKENTCMAMQQYYLPCLIPPQSAFHFPSLLDKTESPKQMGKLPNAAIVVCMFQQDAKGKGSLHCLFQFFHWEVVLLEVFDDGVVERIGDGLLAGEDIEGDVIGTTHNRVAVVISKPKDPVISCGKIGKLYQQFRVGLVSIYRVGIGLSDDVVHPVLHFTCVVNSDCTIAIVGVNCRSFLAADVERLRNVGKFVPLPEIFIQIDFAHSFWGNQNRRAFLDDNDNFRLALNGQQGKQDEDNKTLSFHGFVQ